MKRTEQLKEFRGSADLSKEVSSLKEELMKLRFRASSGQLDSSSQPRVLRKRIARAKTVQREQQQ